MSNETLLAIVVGVFTAVMAGALAGIANSGPRAKPVTQAGQKKAEASSPSGGPCMPCVGPHIRYDGKIGILSIGPGIGF